MTGSSNISDYRRVERLWPKNDPLPAELPIITHHIRHLDAFSAPACCAAIQTLLFFVSFSSPLQLFPCISPI